MKKLILAALITSTFSTLAANQTNLLDRQPTASTQISNIISVKREGRTAFQIIVEFKSPSIHKSLTHTPEIKALKAKREAERNSDISTLSAVSLMSEGEFNSTYNIKSNIDKIEGINSVEMLENDLGIKITHIRSLSLGRDLLEVTSNLDSEKLIKKMKAHYLLSEVLPNTNNTNKLQYSQTTSFNDTGFNKQPYFGSQGENVANGNFSKMKENQVNNLGRKLRIGIIDSGSWQHEDMNEISEGIENGYDFITRIDSGNEQLRSENHTDGVTIDGIIHHSGHGLGVASTIGAISNNSTGLTGVANADDIEFIYGKVCSSNGATSSCSDVAIYDALFWLSGGSVPGIPNIQEPVDVVNMSLAGFNYSGCNSYAQDVIDYAYDKGITIFVGAGNDNIDAKDVSPASCENVIAVGSLTSSNGGDKSSFSNYGDKIDIATTGSNIYMAKLDDTHSSYHVKSGTSFSSPIAAGIGISLKLKHPELTPTQIEKILKTNSTKITSANGSKDCELLGCGAGSVNGNDVIMSIDNLLSGSAGSVEFLYKGADNYFVAEMNKIKNVCNLSKVSIGTIGAEIEGIEYKVFTGINDTLYTTTADPVIVVESDSDLISYQACFNGACGDVTSVYVEKLVKPSFCK